MRPRRRADPPFSSMARICLQCGADLGCQEPLETGDLKFDRYGDTTWKGEFVHLTTPERRIVFTLLQGEGQQVTTEALMNAIYGEDADLRNQQVVYVWVCRLRKKFRAVDPDFNHIKSSGKGRRMGDTGFRWVV